MLHKRKAKVFAAAFMLCTCAALGDLNDDLFEAARKGDAAAVKALLDKGANVNARFRYEMTPLFFAADRGHTEVVKVLLEHGADVNVKDTFYNWNAIGRAASKGHVAVVRMLLEKGAEGKESVLMTGVASGNPEIVKVALDRGGFKPDTLSQALARAERSKRTEIVELLKKAGALPIVEVKVEPEILRTYVGAYRSEAGMEISVALKDGRLVATVGQQSFALNAVDKTTFRPGETDTVSVTFNAEGGKVAGLTIKQDATVTAFKKLPLKLFGEP